MPGAKCVADTGADTAHLNDLLIRDSFVTRQASSCGSVMKTLARMEEASIPAKFVGYRSPVRQFSSAREKGRARVFFFSTSSLDQCRARRRFAPAAPARPVSVTRTRTAWVDFTSSSTKYVCV